MLFKTLFLTVVVVFSVTEAAFVENLSKCKITDGNCETALVQTILRDIAKTGIPELGIPSIDPIKLTNVSVSILDVIDITLIKGQLKGIKDCVIERFSTNIKTKRATIEITCDLSVKGQYKVYADSPDLVNLSLIKSLLGGDTVHGEGNGKVKMEKLYLRTDFHFMVEKRDGEIYIRCRPAETKYKYEVRGRMGFYADKLYLGKQEATQSVNEVLNQNGVFLVSTFGKPFFDKGMEFLYEFLHKFFNQVPAKYYISDDLRKYIDN